jgi:hypothetical protein
MRTYRSASLLRRPIGLASIAMVSAAFALSACGTDSSQPSAITVKSPAAVLQATGAATEATGTFKTSGSISVNADGMTGSIPIEGFTDKANQAASMSMDMGALMTAAAEKEDTVEEVKKMFGTDFKFEVISIGKTAYLKMGALGVMSGAPSDKWMKIDAAAMGITDAEITGIAGGASADLGLTYLKSVNADGVTEVGKEKVREVDTTHYSGKVGVEGLLKNSAKSQQEKLRKQMVDAGITELPIDVWVDGDGVTRRIKFAVQGNGSTAETVADIVMEFYDFGAKGSIVPPADADVISIDEVPALKEALAQQSTPAA